MEVRDIVQETGIKTIPKKKKCQRAKWLSEEALQRAVKRREVKSTGGHLGIQTLQSDLPPWTSHLILKGLDLIDRGLMNYGRRFVALYRGQGSRPSPRKRNAKKQNGCLRRPYK